VADAIRVDGLAEFTRNLRRLDAELPKAVRVALNDAADVVLGYARPRVPARSGRAARSLRARSTRTQSRVSGGGRRAPYYPWLDFGGRVGPGKSVRRPFLTEGRYIYPGFHAHRAEFTDAMSRALVAVAGRAGIEVD